MNRTINCADLANRRDDQVYFQIVREASENWNETIDLCAKEVCGALLGGKGNADISGVGVLIGYFAQNVIGFVLTAVIFTHFLQNPPSSRSRRWTKHITYVKGALEAYQSCSIFFSASIQLVTVIFHARKDFGGGIKNMTIISGHEIEIGWSVSLLIFVPLFYQFSVPDSFLKRRGLNIVFVSLCGLFHLYIFLSRVYAFSAPEPVGTVVSQPELDALQTRCRQPDRTLSNYERKVSAIIYFTGSSLLFLVLLYKSTAMAKKALLRYHAPYHKKARGFFYFAILPLIAFSQIWFILRVRMEQKEMAKYLGMDFLDDSWGFGQIIALLIWMPVVVEYLYQYYSDAELPSLDEDVHVVPYQQNQFSSTTMVMAPLQSSRTQGTGQASSL